MTHNDIYKKFMIEYDKANITSSYPSLTKTEIVTILNKAYLAILAQKVTGNNQRKSSFEADIKAIEDLRPLITTKEVNGVDNADFMADNETAYCVPDDLLYFVNIRIEVWKGGKKIQPVNIVSHDVAEKYKKTYNNVPWMHNPVAYITSDQIRILTDAYDDQLKARKCQVTYLHTPELFSTSEQDGSTKFELTDTMAEELINLAIIFATEITEAPRLQTKISTLSLES